MNLENKRVTVLVYMCCLCAVLCQEVYGLQAACAAPVLSVYKSLCCTWTCLSPRAFVLVLHQGFCLQELCTSPGRVCLQELCAAPGRVSVYKSLCCTCANLSTIQELCDAPGRVCLQESGQRCTCRCTVEKMFWVCFGLLRNRYVCFGCFDDTCSKLRNKLK